MPLARTGEAKNLARGRLESSPEGPGGQNRSILGGPGGTRTELSAGNDPRTHRKARIDPGREAPEILISLTSVFESISV